MTKPKTRNVLAELGYRRVKWVKTVPSALPGYRVLKQLKKQGGDTVDQKEK